MQDLMLRLLSMILLISAFTLSGCGPPEQNPEQSTVIPSKISEANLASSPFRKNNLFAWCIVPFDAKKRNPEERARMLASLGIKGLAYDWRNEHIPEFDAEIDALNRHGIDLTAFWIHCNAVNPLETPHQKTILNLLERRKIKTQLWVALDMPRGSENKSQEEKLSLATSAIGQLADAAQKIGCSVGLYNHGGWFGEPENQIAIIKRLNRPESDVGMVYNFHHGHQDMDRFAELLPLMQPHLMALNLNGMKTGGPQILALGAGDSELVMLEIVRKSGYAGPVGILGLRADEDVQIVLSKNIAGLKKLLEQSGDTTALQSFDLP